MPVRAIWAIPAAARAALLAAGLSAVAAPLSAERVEVTPAQARVAGIRALQAGDVGLARSIASALLVRDPADAAARALLAATDLTFATPDEAFANARTAYQGAGEDRVVRHDAARVAAQAALQQGRPGAAQIWLRRAAQAAPVPELKTAAGQIFGQIAASRRLRTDLRFRIAPTSNVNRGASSDILVIDGVPTPFTLTGSALALSGVEAVVEGGLAWRLAATETSRTELAFRGYSANYRLSDEAKAIAPGVSGGDFAYASAEVGITHAFAARPDAGAWVIDAKVGHLWYGGADLGDYTGLGLSKTFRLDPDRLFTLGLSAENHVRPDDGDSTILEATGTFAARVANGDRLTLGLTLSDVASPNINQESTGTALSLTWARAEPLFGSARVSATVEASARDYPVFFNGFFNDTGRSDRTLAASIELVLPEAGAYGFAPTVTLRASETRSNVSRYEQDSYGVSFGLRTAF